MQHIHGMSVAGEFRVLGEFQGGQAASMVLEAGADSGEYGNEHPGSVQVLFVIDGGGSARVEEDVVPLSPGDVLIVERGEAHQIRAGSRGLKTMNLYVPSAYDADGKPLTG